MIYIYCSIFMWVQLEIWIVNLWYDDIFRQSWVDRNVFREDGTSTHQCRAKAGPASGTLSRLWHDIGPRPLMKHGECGKVSRASMWCWHDYVTMSWYDVRYFSERVGEESDTRACQFQSATLFVTVHLGLLSEIWYVYFTVCWPATFTLWT